MTGKIVKGIAGFYYVAVDNIIYECKAKGAFRKDKIKPLVGDDCQIDVIDQEEKKGNIISILPRKNQMIRPAVANTDQVIIVFALANPDPNLNLLDRFLLSMEEQEVKPIICFNKCDLKGKEEREEIKKIYEHSTYPVIFTSTYTGEGMEHLKELLQGKNTALAGGSGVGKSSILNAVLERKQMETGDISKKLHRGKHTTRHSEIFIAGKDTYLMDTPGFSSFLVMDMEPDDLRYDFFEFQPYEGSCRFHGCVHVSEPDCAVKQAVEEGKIASSRYENYCQFYQELLEKKNNRYS